MPENQQIQQSKRPNTSFQKQATPVIQTPASNPFSIIQRAKINPKSLTHADVMQLQRTIGNRAVAQLLSGVVNSSIAQQATVQRQEIPEEETCPSCVQRQEIPEEEEPLQGKMIDPIQRQEIPEDKEPLQGKKIGTIQKQEIPEEEEPLQTKKENNTGMPDNLKTGVESLSGIDMSDVRVHYSSSKPAEIGALAYTQGTNIHVAPGQERHLPHEAWHVVQQMQRRVRPTMQLQETEVNDDKEFEKETDLMRGKVGQREVSKPLSKISLRKLDSVTQRLVSTAIKSDEDDRVFQNTTLTAHTLVGGKIKKLDDTNFATDFGTKVEGLAITAHGGINKVGAYTPDIIANRLANKDTGLQEGTHDIFFQSCYAAVADKVSQASVISTVKDKLRERGKEAGWEKIPKVTGSNGPQITTRIKRPEGGVGVIKAVVRPEFSKIARMIQDVLTDEIADVKKRVPLDYKNEGENFVTNAETDEPNLSAFKEIFIYLVSGKPNSVSEGVREKLKMHWEMRNFDLNIRKWVFDEGLDLRSQEETIEL